MRASSIFINLIVCFIFTAIKQPSTTFAQTGASNPHLLDAISKLSVVAVGDLMLGSWVLPNLEQHGAAYPFKFSSPYLQSGDAAIANLEAPFTEAGEPFEKKYNFKVPPKYAPGVKSAGIDVVTLANNHIMDFGETGLMTTLQSLDSAGIFHCGASANLEKAHEPAVVEVAGKTVAFFGYSMTFPKEFYAQPDSSGTAYPQPELLQAHLKKWEKLADFSVVSFHWSAEKLDTPKDYQIYFAHLAIESGADLVLGHHPHILQGLEIYQNKLIAYSLGNFVFGSYSKNAVDSIILKVYLSAEGLLYAQCIPINVDNREVEFQPRIAADQRKKDIISKLQKLSLPLNQEQNIISDNGFILGNWQHFYDDWLLDTVISTYWYILDDRGFLNEVQLEFAEKSEQNLLTQ